MVGARREMVREGRWLYDGSVYRPVFVVRLDHDFWYEIGRADDRLEPGEQQKLNDEGFQYYVCFRSHPTQHPGWVDSQGFDTAEAASRWAEQQVPDGIEWHL
jgi:hypothetical protein